MRSSIAEDDMDLKRTVALFLVVVCLLLPGCANPRVTRANYDLIQEGMEPAEVERILGKPSWTHKNEMYYLGKYGRIKIEIEKGLVEDKDWDDKD